MGIVRDLYYAKKMSAGLQLPAPSSAALIKRMYLAKHMGAKNLAGPLEKGTFQESKAAGTPYDDMKSANDYRLRSIDLIPIDAQKVTISLADYTTYNFCACLYDADGLYLGGQTFVGWKGQDYTLNNASAYFIACVIKRLDGALMNDSDKAAVNLRVVAV